MDSPVPTRTSWTVPVALAAVAAGVAGWAYYPTLAGLTRLWSSDPNYSQGFLVPLLAAGLVFHRCWGSAPTTRPAVWAGLGAVAVATAARGAAAYFYLNALDHLSVLVTLAGLILVFGGWAWLGRLWPALAVLVFAFPIPPAVGGSNLIAGLQEIATKASTFLLQALGTTAYREGNVILTPAAELGIVEACSGLRMLMVFCALAVVTAVLIPLGPVQKVVLAASAVPLAIACNVVRITAAGLASASLGSEAGHFVFHDLAGWLMVPLAFALLAAEIAVLAKLVRPAAAGRG